MLRRKSIWMAVCAALMMVGSAMTAATAASAAPSMTPEQRSTISRAARDMGADPQQVKTILADPKLAFSIPVETVRTTTTNDKAHTDQVAPGPGCNQVSSHLKYYNVYRVNIWTYSINKYWCWDGRVVTYAPQASNSFWVHSTLSSVWHYRGNISAGQFGIEPQDGRFVGDQSWSEGRIEHCIIKWGCSLEETPTVLVTGWGDGHFDTNAWN